MVVEGDPYQLSRHGGQPDGPHTAMCWKESTREVQRIRKTETWWSGRGKVAYFQVMNHKVTYRYMVGPAGVSKHLEGKSSFSLNNYSPLHFVWLKVSLPT